MKNISIIVQASSRSWLGGKDRCMDLLNGKQLLYHTIKELIDYFGKEIENIWLIAPEFDRGGLEFLQDFFGKEVIKTFYGYDANPLARMIEVTKILNDDDYVLRVNGINFCIDIENAFENLQTARKLNIDSIRFPDNFPALFTSDIYRVGALRKMHSFINFIEAKYYIHPKYYMSRSSEYTSMICEPEMKKYSKDYLFSIREQFKNTPYTHRIEVNPSKAIKTGDQSIFHYELGSKFLQGSANILDLACGSGYGTKILKSVSQSVTGIDNDPEIIDLANNHYHSKGVDYLLADILNLPFKDNSIDSVVAFEIVEHVAPANLLKEIHRVLKPNGNLCLSTPQNCLGNVPIESAHIKEFSLDEIKDIVGEFFKIVKIIGIKQGTIFYEDDPVGSNTFIIAKKL